jgi:hypothetical protein
VDNLGMIGASLLCLVSVQMGISASGVFLVLALVTAGIVALLRIPSAPTSSTNP